jgi:hypothetical protein
LAYGNCLTWDSNIHGDVIVWGGGSVTIVVPSVNDMHNQEHGQSNEGAVLCPESMRLRWLGLRQSLGISSVLFGNGQNGVPGGLIENGAILVGELERLVDAHIFELSI